MPLPNSYPLIGFRFKVEFAGMGEPVDMSFQEVSGLEVKVETEDLREGGEYGFVYRLPKGLIHSNLSLKRGLLTDSRLSQWVRDALEDFTFNPLLVSVSLLDEVHTPLMTWQAHQAWPVRWSLTSLDATANAVVIETLELAYANLRLTYQRT
ncbi:MAG: phage tail protein [Desulfovibrio sp.]|uniref:phage tail protein n=1 Tax=Desulfovibrio sp. TaxID=885 RepID=UPI0039E4EF20